MAQKKSGISIGRLANRVGLAVSAVRFYEEKGLITANRNAAGQRIFLPSDIRKVSFILIAQQLGFTLAEIKTQLDRLPGGRAPSQRDWEQLSHTFKTVLDNRIDRLIELRERLSGCIGCGCLSLKNCILYNSDDRAGQLGSGPRYLMGDRPQV